MKTESGEDTTISWNKARFLLNAFCGRAVLLGHKKPVHGGSVKSGQLMVCSFMRLILSTSHMEVIYVITGNAVHLLMRKRKMQKLRAVSKATTP